MRTLFFLIVTLILSCEIQAQSETQKLSRKEQKALKKAERARQDSLNAIKFELLINSKYWVLEARQVGDKTGRMVNCNSSLNFITLEDSLGFVQIGNNFGYGPNMVGGVSGKGSISNYKIKKDQKHGSYYISYMINTPTGTYDIKINVNATGDYATATVQSIRGGKINYSGTIISFAESTVYKGRTLF